MAALTAKDEDTMYAKLQEAEYLIIDKYCLGYPVVIASSSSIIYQPNIEEFGAGFIGGYNDMECWGCIRRAK